MNKITAIIPTFNEQMNIRKCLESCLFADEVIVVDSFSSDKTLEIIAEYPQVKLIQRKYEYSASQKNWAIPQAKNDWIFLLDADEWCTPELEKEVCQIVQNAKHVSYWINRQNYFMDKKLNFLWKSDAVIRLFRKSKCHYEDKHVHAEVVSDGSVGRLKNRIHHDTYKGKGLESHLIKANRYTTWAALDRVDKIKKINAYHLLVKPIYGFIKRYFLKLGILDGKAGFVISCMGSWNIFIRNVKIMRMHKGEKFSTEGR